VADPAHSPPALRVECYAGYRGEETPRRFQLGGFWIEVSTVVDRWLAPDHRYFKLQDERGHLYLLRHDARTRQWELTSSSAGPCE